LEEKKNEVRAHLKIPPKFLCKSFDPNEPFDSNNALGVSHEKCSVEKVKEIETKYYTNIS
jgi:hypothetical protein